MPRRGFFRGSSGDKKKSNKREQKLQQKQAREQQRQQRRLSTSQASSSINASSANDSESEPPLALGGPPQTAPPRAERHAFDARVGGLHFQPSAAGDAKPPPQHSPPAVVQVSNRDVDQLHQRERQLLQNQYQTQSSVRPSHPQQYPQYEEPAQHYVPQQQQGTPPFVGQPQQGISESPSQQFPQYMLPPGAIPPQHSAMAQNATPTVDNTIDEIWRCETDDFRSASHSIQMLRLAIVSEWESQQMLLERDDAPTQFSYDPSDTFLSLQGATLRFHARFETMKAERDGLRASQRQALQLGDASIADSHTLHSHNTLNSQSLNGVEWELTEQAAWEVWEESVRASAALTHSCVGPAWRRQLRLRRQLIRETEMRLLNMQQRQFAADNMSVGSSAGYSWASSLVSMDISNPQSSGRYLQPHELATPPAFQPHRDILEMLSFSIPEVLPAAMIRFAASVIETSIPPLRLANTKVYWDESDKAGIAAGSSEALLTARVGQDVHDERRWLRRRKRLGDTQRDLAFGLFCGGNGNGDNADGQGNAAAETGGAGGEKEWSIPGTHTPVAVMIHSWLDTCQAAWPVPREIEEGDIPCHVEVSVETSEEGGTDSSAGSGGPPPMEIVLPTAVNASTDPGAVPPDANTPDAKDATPEPQSGKFSYWGELVDLSRVDFWYTLRVLRDCSDLVSAGWRPPPSGRVGEGIILNLISIAERGITHLTSDDDVTQKMPEEQIRKERLVACSCASESLVSIKTLASRDVIPQATLRPLAISLCQLISAAETPISSVSSTESEEAQEEDALLYEREILTQRTFVASNSAELLWVLLSNEGTSCPTADALLDSIDMNLHHDITVENRVDVEESVIVACGAIRALSAAMWGDPPAVKGVPLLRFFWEPVIDLFGAVASSFFPGSGAGTFDIAGHDTSVIAVADQEECNDSPYLNIILEIVLAFQRLVDSEMVYGTGDLCATEWESFVKALDIGISPWLVRHGNGSGLMGEIRSECMTCLSQLTSFLFKCSQSECGFHLVVDDDARNYMHQLLLRKIVPLIVGVDSFSMVSSAVSRASGPSSEGLVGDDSTTLALAVIKSCCVIRYLPFKEGSWAKLAGNLLAEAFAVPDSQNAADRRYINGYLHHPLIRLEALKSLIDDDVEDNDVSIRDSDSVSTSGISAMTPVSIRSGNVPPSFSLFSLTKNLRELHLVLVNTIILPRLEELLSVTEPILETTECQPKQGSKKIPTAQCFDIIEKEFLLRRFAVKMLGMVFRSRTGEVEKRGHFIDLLQKVATSTPYGIREWVRLRQREIDDEQASSGDVGTISASEFLKGEELNLRFEAIRQIEICLGAPFSSLPHTHGNLSDLLKALGDSARFYSTEYDDHAEHQMGQTDRLLMTLAAILPLARLSCARNGQAIIMSRQHVTQNIPSDILSVVSVDEWLHNTSPVVLNEALPMVSEENDFTSDDIGEIAPFVFVKQYHTKGKEDIKPSQQSNTSKKKKTTRRLGSNIASNGKQGTIVDFEPIVAAIKTVLDAVCQDNLSHDDEEGDLMFDRIISPASISQLPSIVRTICYGVISSFLSYGMASPGMGDLVWLDLEPACVAGQENELVARSEAVSIFAGVLGHITVSRIGEEENNLQLGRRVCDVLVRLSMADCLKVVQHSCCGLISILSSLRHTAERKASKGRISSPDASYDAAITGSLISFIGHVCSVLQKEESDSDLVLIPLVDAMREAVNCSDTIFEFPKSLRRRAFLILFQPSRERWEVQVIAFQAAVSLVNAMTAKEASLMTFFAIGPPKSVQQLPNSKRIQPLLIDLLRYRLMAAQMPKKGAGSEVRPYKPSLVHERLAREALSMEVFPIDLDSLGSPKVAAWKCGNAILTLRLGSKDSLHRGWVEVVFRSPCARIRRLVKWKKEFITSNPGSSLPFWQQLQPRQKKEETTKDAELEAGSSPSRRTDEAEPDQFVESEESLKIMANAKAVIARFDSLVPLADSPAEGVSEEKSASKIAAAPQRRQSFRRNSTFGMNSNKQTAATGGPSLKRTFSDGDLLSLSVVPKQESSRVRRRSVFYSWLQYATGRETIDVDLIQEILALGFSRSALGVPGNVITATSCQDLFVHEWLKPYAVSPNFNRAMTILDRVTPFQTHRIALFYGGTHGTKRSARGGKADSKNGKDGDKFLTSTQASTDFWQFSRELGDLVPVRHLKYFSGGLDTSESVSDGEFAFVWFGCQGGSYELNDPILVDSMVVFHSVTLMPDRLTNRKRHVGNDVVHIVYGLDIDTLDVDHERMAVSGHFGFITIYVIPLVHVPLFKVSVHLKAGLEQSICSALEHLVGSWLISRRVGAHFVRNLAMQADVICQSMIEDKLGLVLNTEDRGGRIRDTERHLA
ncbi:hypothetical protein ACHAXT_000892 [Thalassiosira profunda]